MREIKFRAWDIKNNKWLELDYPTQHMNPFTGKIMFDEDNSCSDPECCGGPNPMWEDNDNYILCQYTGLKDKNGKEIYEGDMISYGVGSLPIKFNNGCFCYTNIEGEECRLYQNMICACEVIGNIYED